MWPECIRSILTDRDNYNVQLSNKPPRKILHKICSQYIRELGVIQVASSLNPQTTMK